MRRVITGKTSSVHKCRTEEVSLLYASEAIARAPDRLDVLRLRRVLLELLPQAVDVHRDGRIVPELSLIHI